MKEALAKFIIDLATAGVSAAAVAVYGLNLDTANAKTVAVVAVIAFLNGVINAARRALPTS